MAMSGNMGAAMAPKRMAREKRMLRQSRTPLAAPAPFPAATAQMAMPQPKKMSPPVKMKPLAPSVSTKPSDTPMAREKMKMAKPVSGIAPMPAAPKLSPKPVGKTPVKGVSRPKTGLK